MAKSTDVCNFGLAREPLATPVIIGVATHRAAKYLGVSASYLEKLRVTGGGPMFCVCGTRRIYRPDDLDAWLASRRVASTSEPRRR